MGRLHATPGRGKEVFRFEYDRGWLASRERQEVDPELLLFDGPQYPAEKRANFGVFLDSSPDRWGRVLMRRREEREARRAGRPSAKLLESDYLLGVHDQHRIGALRFKLGEHGPFLDDRTELAAPPMARLRELENASLQIEKDGAEDDKDYDQWLRMLIAPGGSLGGARPKASVIDADGSLWIAKFPSRNDEVDLGGWEKVVHDLAERAGVATPEATAKRFNTKRHVLLSRRFDRTQRHRRIHFASARTLGAHGAGVPPHGRRGRAKTVTELAAASKAEVEVIAASLVSLQRQKVPSFQFPLIPSECYHPALPAEGVPGPPASTVAGCR